MAAAMDSTRTRGGRSEAAAEKFYNGLGFLTVARNFRCRAGELDLVLLQGGLLLFVEVKGREGGWENMAWRAHWGLKARRLHAAVRAFLQANPHLDFSELRLEVAFITQGRVTARFDGL